MEYTKEKYFQKVSKVFREVPDGPGKFRKCFGGSWKGTKSCESFWKVRKVPEYLERFRKVPTWAAPLPIGLALGGKADKGAGQLLVAEGLQLGVLLK